MVAITNMLIVTGTRKAKQMSTDAQIAVTGYTSDRVHVHFKGGPNDGVSDLHPIEVFEKYLQSNKYTYGQYEVTDAWLSPDSDQPHYELTFVTQENNAI